MGQLGDRTRRGELHCLVNGRGGNIESAAKNVGKAKHVVDLIWKIRAPGANQGVRPRRECHAWLDFGSRVGERHDQRPFAHLLRHLRRQDASRRKPEKNIGAADDILERARIGILGIDLNVTIHQRLAAAIHHAFDVGDKNVLALGAENDQEIKAGKRGRAGARCHDLDAANCFTGKFHGVEDRRADDDRGAVLIVVKHRNRHAFAQLALDLETLRRLDILEIDAAKRWLQRGYDVHQPVDIGLRDLDVEHIDPGEFLEQNRLAFHHRFAREGTDVAKSQDRGAIGHHPDEILPYREFGRRAGIDGDREACRGDAGRIGKRQIMLRPKRLGCHDLELAGARRTMVEERARRQIGTDGIGHRPAFYLNIAHE